MNLRARLIAGNAGALARIERAEHEVSTTRVSGWVQHSSKKKMEIVALNVE